MTCSIEGCDRPRRARGWCIFHYNRWYYTGTTDDPPPPPTREERFWAKVDKDAPNGCWEWTAWRNPDGYGGMQLGGRNSWVLTHRFSWFLASGEWPELHVLHRCDNPPCCNPAHLFLGTDADNHADRDAKGRNYWSNVTHCAQGHEFTPENTRTYPTPSGGTSRKCIACGAESQRRYRARRKESV